MAGISGAATRAALSRWLGDICGPGADEFLELRALQRQIQVVEENSHVVGDSDRNSDSFPNDNS